ncbi:MAG: hypothetical protein ACRDJH_16135 [Thermomicrobiales bacterium]
MRRGCLIAVVAVLGLCGIGCGLVWFVVLPRIQDEIAGEFEDAVATSVAGIPAITDVRAGTAVVTEQMLNESFTGNVEGSEGVDVENIVANITPAGVEIVFDLTDQDATYSGQVVAEDGALVVRDMEVDPSQMGWFVPADKMAGAIEDGVNGVLEANNLRLRSVELGDGQMTLTTEAAP